MTDQLLQERDQLIRDLRLRLDGYVCTCPDCEICPVCYVEGSCV